jgi:hypothetical protein
MSPCPRLGVPVIGVAHDLTLPPALVVIAHHLIVTVPHDHPVWCDDLRIKFIKTVDHLRQAIRYVHNNFGKSQLPPQNDPFITHYSGEWSGRQSRK